MKRINRVRKNKDFKTIISKNKKVENQSFKIFYSKNDLNLTRIGISVSKKIGNAVIRNKTKRQIKAMLNTLVKFEKNIDIVIIVRDGYLKNTFESNLELLRKIIDGIYEKEKII